MSQETPLDLQECLEITDSHGEKFRVLALLGEGGMSNVYRVLQTSLSREVALKLMKAQQLDQSMIMRLMREARATAALNHPNIIRIFSSGLTDKSEPFLLLEYFKSESLAETLAREKTLSENMLVPIFEQILGALEAAHGQGFAHRDLKPSNVLLGDNGHVKLADFGIAKSLQTDTKEQNLTATGQLLGSPTFMSPEQCRGDVVDARTDIYSVGCMLYQALTGVAPFAAESAMEMMYKHLFDAPPVLPSTYKANYRRMIEKSLAKDPAQRYQTAAQMKAELREQYDTADLATSQDADALKNSSAKKRKRQTVLWLIGATLVGVITIASVVINVPDQSEMTGSAKTAVIPAEAYRRGRQILERAKKSQDPRLRFQEYSRADALATKALTEARSDEDIAKLHYLLGETRKRLDDNAGAIDHFELAVQVGETALKPEEYVAVLGEADDFYEEAMQLSRAWLQIYTKGTQTESLRPRNFVQRANTDRLLVLLKQAQLYAGVGNLDGALDRTRKSQIIASLNKLFKNEDVIQAQLLRSELYAAKLDFVNSKDSLADCEPYLALLPPALQPKTKFRCNRLHMLLAQSDNNVQSAGKYFKTALDLTADASVGPQARCQLQLAHASWLLQKNQTTSAFDEFARGVIEACLNNLIDAKTAAEAKTLMTAAQNSQHDHKAASDFIAYLKKTLGAKLTWGYVKMWPVEPQFAPKQAGPD
jgi:serine/threonine protein kinase